MNRTNQSFIDVNECSKDFGVEYSIVAYIEALN